MTVSGEKIYCAARMALIALVLLAALFAGLHTVGDSDMGWHLATGRWVVQHREIPRTDVLSFTSAGTKWIYPPFAGVLLYLIYSGFGYAGLSWVCALACLGVVAYLIRRGDFASTLLAMLATGSIAVRTGARADLFTTVLFAFVLGELWAFHRGIRSRLWLLPVLMLFWVNLHPGFVAGIAAIGAYLLVEGTDLLFAERREGARLRLRRCWPWLVASVAVTLVNPWGPKIYGAALNMLGAAGSTLGKINGNIAIAEFRGVPISSHLFYELLDVRHPTFGFTWLLVLAGLGAGISLWRRQIGRGVILLAAFYAALAHIRYSALFAIVVVTLAAEMFENVVSTQSKLNEKRASRVAMQVPVGLALVLSVFVCGAALLQISDLVSNRSYIVFNPDVRFGAGVASWLPVRAADFILREQLPGNIFEDYELGGFAAWRLGPKYPDFIDGRGVDPDLGVEQVKLYNEDPDSMAWENLADRWNLNVIWMSTAGYRSLQNPDPYKFCQSTSWRAVYMDEVSLVFVRNTDANSPWLSRLQIDCATKKLDPSPSQSRSKLHEFYLDSGSLFYALHRDEDAEKALLAADELYPFDPNVHLLMALLFERREQYAQAEREYLTSLAINENGGTWYSLSRLYGRVGRNEEALQALKRAAGLSIQPFTTYMTMGKLQVLLNRPEQALDSFDKAEKTSPYRGGAESLQPEFYADLAEGRSEAYRRLSRWNQAIGFQQEAVQIAPNDVRRWDRLARLYEATGQATQASEVRERMIGLQDRESAAPEADK
jgi:tetratricopeptide (TPR) repeat protein